MKGLLCTKDIDFSELYYIKGLPKYREEIFSFY